MEHLLQQSRQLVARTTLTYRRFLFDEIRWDWRLVGIKGPRGVGKTTLLLQRLSQEEKGIYLTLDDLHFTAHNLRETVAFFRSKGLVFFFLDEVHKYPDWSREVKNLYDFFPDIFIVFTGSSIIELSRQDVDLSRRAVLYELPGLSFREYLDLVGIGRFPAVTLPDIFSRHESIALDLSQQFRPLEHFHTYLRTGYYPFFLENRDLFLLRLKQVVRLVLETDLTAADGGRVQQIQRIGQLLQIIAESVPFKPNIQQLAGKVQLDRGTLLRYLQHLENARLIALLYPEGKTLSALQKPEKIFLDNPNLAFALRPDEPDVGNIRETFFFNQTHFRQNVTYTDAGDFRLQKHWVVEVGGKTKSRTQINRVADSFLAVDNTELGLDKRIPLWLFGFLY